MGGLTSPEDPDVREHVTELSARGITVLPARFDGRAVARARGLVLDNRHLLKNTRPSPSSRHLAGFHRFPELEPLHTMLTGDHSVLALVRAACDDHTVRSLGISDITVNRSQCWHKDLLRGPYRSFLDPTLVWSQGSGAAFRVVLYLQDSTSLHVIEGSHRTPISLTSDEYAEPASDDGVTKVPVAAGDVVVMDVRTSHRGSSEDAFVTRDPDDRARMLVATTLGRNGSDFVDALEAGNAQRLRDWTERHR